MDKRRGCEKGAREGAAVSAGQQGWVRLATGVSGSSRAETTGPSRAWAAGEVGLPTVRRWVGLGQGRLGAGREAARSRADWQTCKQPSLDGKMFIVQLAAAP